MLKFPVLLLFIMFSAEALATSVSFLWGDNFRDDLGYEEEKLTMTVENFSVWEYGTVFYFFDLTEPFSDNNGDSNQYFGGIASTLSFSKVRGKDFSWGIVRDVHLRVELENGSGYGVNNFRNYFYGFQYDLAIAGFDFFSLNTLLRDNPNSRGVGVQIGAFWQMSWDYGRWNRYKFTGFFVTSPWDGDQDPELTFFARRGRFLSTQPQLLWDLGQGLFNKANRLEVGVEYAYYLNRYQLKDKDEKVLQLMTKISF